MMNFPRNAISLYLKIALVGFAVAAIGVVLGFAGVGADVKWIAQIGFFVVLLGILVGLIGIFLGWYKEGRSAIQGSRKAAENLMRQVTDNCQDDDKTNGKHEVTKGRTTGVRPRITDESNPSRLNPRKTQSVGRQ